MPYRSRQANVDYWKRYREKHKVRRALQMKAWATEHRESLLLYYKAYYIKHKPARNAQTAAHSKRKQLERLAIRMADPVYRMALADKAAHRKNRSTHEYNRARHKALNARKRARLNGNWTSVNERKAYSVVWQSKTFVCYYCQKRVPISLFEMDHVVPISRSGPHELGNLARSCRPCNRLKANNKPGEVRWLGQQMLNL